MLPPSGRGISKLLALRRHISSLSSLLPPNPSHSSLASYLAHARRNGLSATSPTFVGTRYEYIVSDALRRLGIDSVRVGQAGDRGVDLIGDWHLPPPPPAAAAQQPNVPAIRVVVQCKRLTKKVTPSVVRELEGSFAAATPSTTTLAGGAPVMGLVVGTMAATKGVVDGLKRAGAAVVWVCVQEVDDGRIRLPHEHEANETESEEDEARVQDAYGSVTAGKIRQVLWNHKASALGLEGVDVVKRHYTTPHEQQTGDEVELHWRGRKLDSLSPSR